MDCTMLAAGDEVAVIRSVGAGMVPGTVEKVARVNLTVRTEDGKTMLFRRATGQADNGYWRLGDMAAHRERQRRSAAMAVLRRVGLTVHHDPDRAPSTVLLEELADVIRRHEADHVPAVTPITTSRKG